MGDTVLWLERGEIELWATQCCGERREMSSGGRYSHVSLERGELSVSNTMLCAEAEEKFSHIRYSFVC